MQKLSDNNQPVYTFRKFSCLEVAKVAGLKPGKKSGNELLYLCPRHDDHNPSLAINPTKNVWLCRTCGEGGNAWQLAAWSAKVDLSDKAAINAWLRVKGLLNGHQPRTRRPVATYSYVDESGTLLFQTVRFEPKAFSQRRPDGNGGWTWNLHGVRLVPYRLADFLNKESVAIVEGEKDADALWKWGFAATTNPLGAGKWRPEFNEYFRDKRVVLLPDDDEPGERHILDVARNLHGVAQSIKIVPLPDLPPKGDVSAWIAAGGTKEQLLALIQETQPLRPEDLPNNPSATRNERSWPERKALPSLLPEAPALPPGMLPAALHDWAVDTAERAQIPLEFIAAPAIVAAAATVGRQIGIRPKRLDDWLVVPNLWGAIVARPGMLKSPAIAEALKPFHKLAAKARQDFCQESARLRAGQETQKALIEAVREQMRSAARKNDTDALAKLEQELASLETKTEALQVAEPRYFTNDTTVEKLAVLMRENPRGLLVYRDELSGWWRTLEKPGREGDREFFLEGWNGNNPFRVDRIGRGTIHVDALCISMLGGIQPGKLERYIADATDGGWGDDGLLQRFQVLVYPESPTDWKNIDRIPNREARERAYEAFLRLDRLDLASLGTAGTADVDTIPCLNFSDDAQGLFDEWRDGLEKRLRSREVGSPSFESHLAKYRSLMPSLALIFHLIDHGTDGRESGAVSLQATKLAAAWCEFLESHAHKVYAVTMKADIQSAYKLAEKIRQRRVKDGDRIRDIYRNQWSFLTTTAAVYGALAILAEHGWLRRESFDTDGRPSEIVKLHPDLEGSSDL